MQPALPRKTNEAYAYLTCRFFLMILVRKPSSLSIASATRYQLRQIQVITLGHGHMNQRSIKVTFYPKWQANSPKGIITSHKSSLVVRSVHRVLVRLGQFLNLSQYDIGEPPFPAITAKREDMRGRD